MSTVSRIGVGLLGACLCAWPSLAMAHDADFREASRVGDGVAAGWYALALGRWHAGVGGLALAQSVGRETVAVRALQSLDLAVECFSRQGMDPWIVLALTHAAKAYADLKTQITGAVTQYRDEVRDGTFPDKAHGYE